MRSFIIIPILISTAALALAACGKSDTSQNTQNVDQSLGADNIVANDVTAIDAVTGDAANMAADVDYSNELDNGLDNALDNAVGNVSGNTAAKPAKPRRKPATTVNTTANAAENAL